MPLVFPFEVVFFVWFSNSLPVKKTQEESQGSKSDLVNTKQRKVSFSYSWCFVIVLVSKTVYKNLVIRGYT